MVGYWQKMNINEKIIINGIYMKKNILVRNIGHIAQKKIDEIITSKEEIKTIPSAIRYILRSYQENQEKDKLINKLAKRNEQLEIENLIVRKHLLIINKNLEQKKETVN